jgi:bla regulator protein blaR1
MKTRILAIALPVILLTCFVTLSGWQPGPTDKDPQDTTKKSKKGASYSKKTIITFDENGEPHEQIFEDFDGDEGLRKLVIPGHNFEFNMPPLPDFDFVMPPFPDEFRYHFRPDFDLDSLDEFRFKLGDMEDFGEEMEKLMKEKFEAFGPQFEEGMKQMEEQLRNMDMSLNMQLDGMNKNLGEQLKNLDLDLSSLDFNLKDLDENLKNLDEDLKYMNESLKAFEKDAQQELVKDGYLEQGEKIESMEWNDGNIKFNKKEIKPEHLEKYRELKEKHIKHQWRRGRPE